MTFLTACLVSGSGDSEIGQEPARSTRSEKSSETLPDPVRVQILIRDPKPDLERFTGSLVTEFIEIETEFSAAAPPLK
ncbi:hypothetical protein LIER_38158 [Lithospermum erythrorhizon]|uniref:Uncharacterized protein n=1 Tax=Lithospermum erythrorhizon TaxID=34254 RepID=A0AAV3PWD2_LITER